MGTKCGRTFTVKYVYFIHTNVYHLNKWQFMETSLCCCSLVKLKETNARTHTNLPNIRAQDNKLAKIFIVVAITRNRREQRRWHSGSSFFSLRNVLCCACLCFSSKYLVLIYVVSLCVCVCERYTND